MITEYPVTGGPYEVGPIVAGLDGALWYNGGDRIGRITTAGVATTFEIPTWVYNFTGEIAAGPDGALWFTDGNNTIGRVVPTGAACSYTLPQASRVFSFGQARGSAGIRVQSGGPGGCLWTAVSSVSWVTITSGAIWVR